MVFLAACDSVTKGTSVFVLSRIQRFSLRKVAKMRYISPKSAWRLINDDFPGTESTYKGLTVKRKPIQPLFNSGRHGSYVIEGKGGEEGGVSTIAVSVRKVCRFLTSKGYYYLQSTKKRLSTSWMC